MSKLQFCTLWWIQNRSLFPFSRFYFHLWCVSNLCITSIQPRTLCFKYFDPTFYVYSKMHFSLFALKTRNRHQNTSCDHNEKTCYIEKLLQHIYLYSVFHQVGCRLTMNFNRLMVHRIPREKPKVKTGV